MKPIWYYIALLLPLALRVRHRYDPELYLVPAEVRTHQEKANLQTGQE